MAFYTAQCCMFPGEGKCAAIVSLAVKKRRLEAGGIVTRRTIGARSSQGKLSPVRVGMTVPAKFMGNRAFKLSLLVAFSAGQSRVLSDQREFCSAMIETNACTAVLEAAGIVALFARDSRFQILECTLVLIIVAALATVEG